MRESALPRLTLAASLAGASLLAVTPAATLRVLAADTLPASLETEELVTGACCASAAGATTIEVANRAARLS